MDPMERLIKDGLNAGGYGYTCEGEKGSTQTLDFYLPDLDLYIEVKRFHSDRIAAQMARHPNVIAVQGERAVRAFASILAGAKHFPPPRTDGEEG